jgi:serine protease Do
MNRRRLTLGWVLSWTALFWSGPTWSQTTDEPHKAPQNSITTSGTGFLVAPGYLLTAQHLVEGKDFLYVGPNAQNKWLRAKLIKSSKALDVALLQVPFESPVVQLARWTDVPVGLEVYAIGYPQPGFQGFSKKITQGIINGNRGNSNDLATAKYFQFSAEVSKGNSGGPVFAGDGSVVGMVQRKLNALSVAEKSNDLVINVNYGLKPPYLIDFLRDTPAAVREHPLDLSANPRPHQLFKSVEASVYSVIARNAPPKPRQP